MIDKNILVYLYIHKSPQLAKGDRKSVTIHPLPKGKGFLCYERIKQEKIPTLYELYQELKACPHCDQNIQVRNPTGYCDHLYYPNECTTCKEIYSEVINERRKTNHIDR